MDAEIKTRFYGVGKIAYRFRYVIILLWILAIALCIPSLPKLMEPFNTSGFENFKSESFKTLNHIQEVVGYQKHRVLILFTKKRSSMSDSQFIQDVKKALDGLDKIKQTHEVIIGPVEHDKNILAVLAFKRDNKSIDVESFETYVKPSKNITVKFGGEDVFLNSINKQTQKDLYKADMVATPVAIVTLLFVFGSVTAAIMPLLVGASCAVIMLGALHAIAFHASLSIFTINIAVLLGLCLSLDYALFIISRFREELEAGFSTSEAIPRTMATAGKAVFFSGLAVFTSLSALLLFPINILVSVGIGGLCAVSLAVFGALTLLPAILSILKGGINFGTLFKISMKENSIWRWIAQKVIRFPISFATFGFAVLLICSLPIKNIVLGIYDYHILPEQSEGRSFFNTFIKSYDEEALTPITVAVHTNSGSIFSAQNVKRAYRLQTKLKNMDDVEKVTSYLSWMPKGRLIQYQTFYAQDKADYPKDVKQILKTSTSRRTAVFYIESKYPSESPETKQLVKDIRNLSRPGLTLSVTGVPANNLDVFDGIYEKMPLAICLILGMTFLVLMVLLKSLFLPFKAIVMNIMSLMATYGSLVFIFQEGHFHEWLNFDPQGSLDISMLVIIFCALFGFSMDYEVFLLSRIHENYLKTHDNDQSIVFGIEHSAKIITSAAWIVIVLCASFLVAEVLMVKAFGFGIAIAIFIDAFTIRIFLVPAIMKLAGRINWYFPKLFRRLFGG